MKSQDLEDMTLWLLGDTPASPPWLARWAMSYPLVRQQAVSAAQPLARWQHDCNAVWQDMRSDHVVVVAHGSGVLAWMAWLYQADVQAHRRVRAVLLVSPLQAAWQEDAAHTLQRARLNCRAALVVGAHDDLCPLNWAASLAASWGARLLQAPQAGHLDGNLHGWQWGMRLLQEMVLSDG